MAAVLCNGISNLCSGSCEVLGSICSLPCKACGVLCDGVSQALRSPFCVYLSITLGLNIPPIIFAVEAFTIHDGGCNIVLTWLAVNAILCAVNIAAAIYISGKIAYDVPGNESNAVTPAPARPASDVEAATSGENKHKTVPKQEATKKSTMWPTIFESNTRARSFSRVSDVLCHDPIVAIYIVIGIGYIVWQTMGVWRRNEAEDCGGGLDTLIWDALMFGYLFILLGATSFGCSLCCLR
mmetsp:Transcript_1574/g.2167  ORF Transcript_1574/g.2167 Transcript_1574/m.2167 type:complete len:239 (+) Transcript_1574:74-790(+)